MFNRLCVLVLMCVLPSYGFAAKPAVPMPVAEELQVELIESQQEIAVVVPVTATAVGMQFGLIGALVGSAVQNSQAKRAEERIAPVRNLLVDYRFNERVRQVLEPKLASEGMSPRPVLTVLPTVWEAHEAQSSAQVPPYALVLGSSYSMDSDFSQMTVNLVASVVDRTVKSNGKIKVVPRLTRTYSFHYPLQGERSEDEAQDWVALGAESLAQLLDHGIAQTTDMLVHDFSAEGRAQWEAKKKGPVQYGEGPAWVRSGRGWAQTMQGSQPLMAGVMPALQAMPGNIATPVDGETEVAVEIGAGVVAVEAAAAVTSGDAAEVEADQTSAPSVLESIAGDATDMAADDAVTADPLATPVEESASAATPLEG